SVELSNLEREGERVERERSYISWTLRNIERLCAVAGRIPVQDSKTWDEALAREDTTISSPPASIEDATRDWALLSVAARLQRRNRRGDEILETFSMAERTIELKRRGKEGNEYLTPDAATHPRALTVWNGVEESNAHTSLDAVNSGSHARTVKEGRWCACEAARWRGHGEALELLVRTRKKREVERGDLEGIKTRSRSPNMHAEAVGRGRGAPPRRGINGQNTASRVLWAKCEQEKDFSFEKYEKNGEGTYLGRRATSVHGLATKGKQLRGFLLHPWVSADTSSTRTNKRRVGGAARWFGVARNGPKTEQDMLRRSSALDSTERVANRVLNLRFPPKMERSQRVGR
ncbi:hypothetical protein B0H14DRAFT_2635163, partial [Mycena olivaceomarginata]